VRLHRDGDAEFLIIGGEDHRTGAEDDGEPRLRRLEEWARGRFPRLENIAYRWSGQVMEPNDGVPFIGLYPQSKRVYVVTGDSGQGLTSGMVGGMLIADLVTTGVSPWAETYDPARKPRYSITQTITENIASVASMAGSLIGGQGDSHGEVGSEADIPRGHGAVVRSGDDKVAVFRDKTGELHRCSAVCTHAGCTVQWNGFEECWDCPCHGSHFAVDGTVLNGPAVAPLEPVKAKAGKAKAKTREKAG
jgi:Rieske Fe-S protein